ncbi:hypothetical protein B0H14DRAFT_2401131, partial [Mycena olivaceomarginata]
MPPVRPFFHPTKNYLTCTVPPPSSSPGTGPDLQHYYRTSPITTPASTYITTAGCGGGSTTAPWPLTRAWGEYLSRRQTCAQRTCSLQPTRGTPIFLQYPELSWGQYIATLFPDLTHLTLQLETFAWHVAELDRIVECAKTWTFPI